MKIYILPINFIVCSTAFGGLSEFKETVYAGQRAAYQILESLPSESFESPDLPEQLAIDAFRLFYTEENRRKLMQELLESEIEFVDSNTNEACGETRQHPKSPIRVAFSRCVFTINSVATAARFLIGEVTHHLGKGDEFTDWIKSAVMAEFEKRFPNDYAELSKIEDANKPDLSVKLQDIVGKVFLTPNVKTPEMFLVLHDYTLVFATPEKLSSTVQLDKILMGPIKWNAARKVYQTTGEWLIEGYEERYWGQGLYERHPVLFRPKFSVEFSVLRGGAGVMLTYKAPSRVDLSKNQVIMKTVTKSFVSNPGREVFNAFHKKNQE